MEDSDSSSLLSWRRAATLLRGDDLRLDDDPAAAAAAERLVPRLDGRVSSGSSSSSSSEWYISSPESTSVYRTALLLRALGDDLEFCDDGGVVAARLDGCRRDDRADLEGCSTSSSSDS